eukprot:TRINITY_DN4430_c0_g1_i1.p1 TRINITY_DN4430_c0_g1~~TRINITY_DN4430_c0_g1_i1.p1  ORF type:complete len:535 (+),score=88.53 TRINITY_DN4430_c0_g1_i1:1406-3010(+)
MLPVTLLSGFLGSGKTTVLRNILKQKKDRVAVIVNDMAEVGVDGSFVKHDQSIREVSGSLVEMQNGCICCTLREELIKEVCTLAKSGRFDYLIIESTGIGEPMAVAEAFSADVPQSETLNSLGIANLTEVAKLDTLVTVVDASTFLTFIRSGQSVADQFPQEEAPEEDEGRAVAPLLADQVECANVIILNKTDLCPEADRQRIHQVIRHLNKDATVVETTFGKIDIQTILHTSRCDLDKLSLHVNWMAEKKPETEEYGISSFVYRRRRPFHGARLDALLQERFGKFCKQGILRSKGFVWMAKSTDELWHWSAAGPDLTLQPSGRDWICCSPQSDQPTDPEDIRNYFANFDPHPFIGDRRQEIVVIGLHLKSKDLAERFITALDACLLTDDEFASGPAAWAGYTDPMVAPPADHDHEEDILPMAIKLVEEGKYADALAPLLDARMLAQFTLAVVHAHLGDKTKALEALLLMEQIGFSSWKDVASEPAFASLQDNEEFRALLSRSVPAVTRKGSKRPGANQPLEKKKKRRSNKTEV